MNDVAAQIADAGLIAIVRAPSSDGLVDAARALFAGGLRVMEVTLNTPGALTTIAAIRAAVPGMTCGAGTVLSPADAAAAINAGARFLVTPALDLPTNAAARTRGVPICAGCASPTEMVAATRAGAHFVKLFPAATFALPHTKAVLEAMPHLPLIPTGGVTPDNLAAYLQAGCPAVAVGSNLVSRQTLTSGDWSALTAAAQRFARAVRAARPHGAPR